MSGNKAEPPQLHSMTLYEVASKGLANCVATENMNKYNRCIGCLYEPRRFKERSFLIIAKGITKED